MKTFTATAVGLGIVFAMVGQASARPIEIATLGRSPLIGESSGPAQMKYNIHQHEATLRTAGMKLGLTPEEYSQFRLAMDVQKPNWVTIPRHLDAMTWASDGRVHVLHDVIIPANQKGVEVDLHEGERTIALFMPARCGNLSLISRSTPHVAAAVVHNVPVRQVVGAAYPASPSVLPPVSVVSEPLIEAPAALPALPVAAAAAHGVGLLPLLAAVPFLFHSGGTGSVVAPLVGNTTAGGGGTIISPPPCPPGTDP